jgi:hypothetical protein
MSGSPVNIFAFMKHCSWSLDMFLSCFSFHSFDLQTVHAGGSPSHDRDLPPANVFDSGVPSPPHSPCRCTEYLSRISDLEGRLSLMKHQAKSALDQAGKSYGLMRQVSALEDKVSGLVAQVMHLKECDSYLVEIIESACEQLKCEFSADPLKFPAVSLCFAF